MASLTEQLDALIAKHDLASITLTRLTHPNGGTFWSVAAQSVKADGTREIGTCGHNHPKVGDALAAAIDALNAKRIAPAEVVDLAPMQVAA